MSRPSEWFRKPRNPWTWPMIALVALVVIVAVGTVLALLLGGCAAGRSVSTGTDGGVVDQQTSTRGMEERKVTLSDGRTITCITWVDSGFQYENTAAGISCDWGAPE